MKKKEKKRLKKLLKQINNDDRSFALKDLLLQIQEVKEKHPDNYNSYHEGYSVLLEECDELWDEVKKNNVDPVRIYEEAKDIACVAIRIMFELGDKMKL